MRSIANIHRCLVAIVVIATCCQVKVVQSDESGDNPLSSKVHADSLPSVEQMLATALKHNPDVRAAQAELDRARLHVVREIRAFREEWRDANEALTEVELVQREVDRLSHLEKGVIPAKKLVEAKETLAIAKRRAEAAESRLKELRLLLPHLLGHAVAANANDNHHHGHHHDAHHEHDHDGIAAGGEKILRERLQVLTKLVDLQHAAYERGEVGFDDVSAAQMSLIAAKLELAKSSQERLKIRQDMLQLTRKTEEMTARLVQANETSQADMLNATALRLRAEADLKRQRLSTGHQH